MPRISISKVPSRDFQLFSLSSSISSKLFKKNLLIKNNIYYEEFIPSEDAIFVYDIILKCKKVAILNDYSVFNRIIRSQGENKSVSFTVNFSFITKLLKAYNIISDKCENDEILEFIKPVVFAKMVSYFFNKLNYNGLSKQELDEIFKTEEYNKFKNREFFKSDVKFNILFDNIYNLETNAAYSAFLKSTIIKDFNYRKEIRQLKYKTERYSQRIDELTDKIYEFAKKNKELTNQN